MYSFKTAISKGKNFVPAGLIYQHGKEKHYDIVNYYGNMYLIINGNTYGYSSYMIEQENDMDIVTVNMSLVFKA